MTSGDGQTVIRAAMDAARDCVDTIETQVDGLLGVIADVPMDAALRAKAVDLCAALRDRAGRVNFELALLEAELTESALPDGSAVRRLVGLDASMMEALAPLAGLADELELAAERDPEQEPAFVLVIEAAGVMLQRLDEARTATAAAAAER